MFASRPSAGIRRIFPFLRDVAPHLLHPFPPQNLAGLTLAIDATLISSRFHFADDPHPARHLYGFLRLIRALRSADARAIMVFDHPLGRDVASRNPAKMHEAERRRGARRLMAARAVLERRRHARIRRLSVLVERYHALGPGEARGVHLVLRAAFWNERREELLRRRRGSDDDEEDEQGYSFLSSIDALTDDARGSFGLDEMRAGSGSSSSALQEVPGPDTTAPPTDGSGGWDDHVSNEIWEELIEEDEQLALAANMLSLRSLEGLLDHQPQQHSKAPADARPTETSTTAETEQQQQVPPELVELAMQFHELRREFERLHFRIRPSFLSDEDQALAGMTEQQSPTMATATENGVAESKNQTELTASEAQIHATMLTRYAAAAASGVSGTSIVGREEDVQDLEVDGQGLVQAAEAIRESSAGADAVAEPDVDEPVESKDDAGATLDSESEETIGKAEGQGDPQLSADGVVAASLGAAPETAPIVEDLVSPDLDHMHTRSSALSRSYDRASSPLRPSMIIDCAHLCALMGVPVLFTSRGASSTPTPVEHTSLPKTTTTAPPKTLAIPGAAWSGPAAPLRARAHEAEALAAQLVRAGVADVVASEDSDVLMYDVPMLRGLLGGGGAQSGFRGMSWVDAREVRRFLFAGRGTGEVGPVGSVEEVVGEDERPEEGLGSEAGAEGDDEAVTSATAKRTPVDEDEINRRQFHEFALLLGTDFNRTIPGVGPKIAYKLIKEHGDITSILRLRNAVSKDKTPLSSSSSSTSQKEKATPQTTLAKQVLQYRYALPASLTRREYRQELSQARAVFNHPPAVYHSLARLRRWKNGEDYYDWTAARGGGGRGADPIGDLPMLGAVGGAGRGGSTATGGTARELRARRKEVLLRARARAEEEWRRETLARLFAKYGVRRIPEEARGASSHHGTSAVLGDVVGQGVDSLPNLGFGAVGFAEDHEAAQQSLVMSLLTEGGDGDRDSAAPAPADREAGSDQGGGGGFGADLFGESAVPSAKLALKMVVKTGRSIRGRASGGATPRSTVKKSRAAAAALTAPESDTASSAEWTPGLVTPPSTTTRRTRATARKTKSATGETAASGPKTRKRSSSTSTSKSARAAALDLHPDALGVRADEVPA
ncbi:hypothetical protein V8E36_006996 [Tilletia maclaganii]